VTALEHGLTVDESDRTHSLAAENDLLVFESRNALNAVFVSAGSKRGFHAGARIGIVLNAKPRTESMSATGTDET
jgi:hypothetical protein